MTPEERAKVDSVGYELDALLRKVEKLFTPGKKLTLLVRDPEYPDGSRDLVMTIDTIEAAIAALQVRLTAPSEHFPAQDRAP